MGVNDKARTMSAAICMVIAAFAPVISASAGTARLVPLAKIAMEEADVVFTPMVFYPGWIARTPMGGHAPDADGLRRWRIDGSEPSGTKGAGKTRFEGTTSATVVDGTLELKFSLRAVATNVTLLGGCVAAKLPCARYGGGFAEADETSRFTIPAKFDKAHGTRVFGGEFRRLSFHDATGRETFNLRFPAETRCYMQDDREWKTDCFSLRIYFPGLSGKAGVEQGSEFALPMVLGGPEAIECETREFVISEGDEWVRLETKNEVVPGSALDFSGMRPNDAPSGKHGWLTVKDGHFEFERLPGVRQRFYGVNFVGEANYPPVEDAERYIANLARIGYNAVRFHHHDQGLSRGKDGVLDRQTMERFDAMVAACIRHGMYMTTDFYVSRHVSYRDIGIDKPGYVEMEKFKDLVETHEGAFGNFLRYAKAFLEHVNPHTGRRYADEPAMPLYSLVNEGDHRGVLSVDNERRFAKRVTKWVREEMKSRILLTNMNNYSYPEEYDSVRADEYDYIDAHFYVDHPNFLEKRWSLPSGLPNVNPVTVKVHGLYRPLSFRRRIAKAMPFVITEYNYTAPGSYRSIGGLETGALAAREDLDGLWRFAWSHGIKGVYGPKPMTYFDVSGDPLSLAGERAAICLFLRGDVKTCDAAAISENRAEGNFTVATGRTCGGFREKGPVEAGVLSAVLDSPATVWASALDGKELAESSRMLFCHLTDVQNSGIAYADSTRRELLRWGTLPHLVRRGRAEVRIRTDGRHRRVYALDCAGGQRGEVLSSASTGSLSFVADVARNPADATIYYEIVSE